MVDHFHHFTVALNRCLCFLTFRHPAILFFSVIAFIIFTPNGNLRQLGLEKFKHCVLIIIWLNVVDRTLRKWSEAVTHGLVMTSPPLPDHTFTRLSWFGTEIYRKTENRWPFARSEITSTRNRSSLRTSGERTWETLAGMMKRLCSQTVANTMILRRNG